jgi:hypothetical protein
VVQAMAITFGVITASVFVYAQEVSEEGFTINGAFIQAGDTQEWTELLTESQKQYLRFEDYQEYRKRMMSELSQKEGETLDEFSLRIAMGYLSSRESFKKLEIYTSGMEKAWMDLRDEKIHWKNKLKY